MRNLADALQVMGHGIKHSVIADPLRQLDYNLHSNRKTREGSNNPDRAAQFAYINAEMKASWTAGQPAISVDTKKKELVGDPRVKPVGMLQECRSGTTAKGAARAGPRA